MQGNADLSGGVTSKRAKDKISNKVRQNLVPDQGTYPFVKSSNHFTSIARRMRTMEGQLSLLSIFYVMRACPRRNMLLDIFH